MPTDNSLFVFSMILYTFGAYSCVQVVYLQIRQYRWKGAAWGGWAWRALTLAFAVFYLFHLSSSVVAVLTDGVIVEVPLAARLAYAAAFPLLGPLLTELFYSVEREHLPRLRVWQALRGAAWVAGATIAAISVLFTAELATPWSFHAEDQLHTASDAMLAAGGVYGAAALLMSRQKVESPFRRHRRQWYLGLIGALWAHLVIQLFQGAGWMATAVLCLPLAFILVTVYYGERLTFFDVFAKRGLLFFVSLVALSALFVVVLPRLDLALLGFARPWVAALSVAPLALATPWAYARLGGWVDGVWLGRRYTPVAAMTSFAESLQGAVTESDLIERAENSLGMIFRSTAHAERGDPAQAPGELRTEAADWGVLRVLPREDEVPFLSEDAALLRALAQSLLSALESLRLRTEKLAQERRAEQLTLTAAQSELKALRAQINPHFLFNALNTIAALIPEQPEKAEGVVEELAEVFRYTVRRSDREWVRLAEEVDFVRAYLEIEQARFGEQLRVEYRLDEAAGEVRIPAMIVQTLTENAIKHGIAAVRGPGLVRVSSRLGRGRLRIAVADSGPGFPKGFRLETAENRSGGYGLRNVSERLRAHYGAGTKLHFERDAAGLTEVWFEVPEGVKHAGFDRG